MAITLTTEQIAKSVSAAYDSIALIDALNAKPTPLSTEDAATLDRNVEHLKIMMAKDWFFSALTSEQKTKIQSYLA